VSDFGRLRSNDRFCIPVHALVWTALSSERPRYLDTWAITKACGEMPGRLSSQPSDSLCSGRGWHFRKSALSTDRFKLKVISQSKLYMHTLNATCIMQVYYLFRLLSVIVTFYSEFKTIYIYIIDSQRNSYCAWANVRVHLTITRLSIFNTAAVISSEVDIIVGAVWQQVT
jgi:hypothetical protein